jgi:O-antigen ligase
MTSQVRISAAGSMVHRKAVAVIPSKLLAPLPKLQTGVLFQVACCAVLLPLSFFLGYAVVGATAFAVLFAILLAYNACRKRPFHFLCLLLSLIPLLSLVRGVFIPFNSMVVVLACGLSCAVFARPQFRNFWKTKTLLWMIVLSVMYWWSSFLLTGRYSENVHALEWSFSAAVVFLLSQRRSFLSTALLGVGISVMAAGLALLPYVSYGDRLGMGVVEGHRIGNPILLGFPAALLWLLCIAEQGRWLLLHRHPVWRMSLGFVSGSFLVFSTSRGSWLVAIVGTFVLVLIDRRARATMFASCLGLILITTALRDTASVKSADHYLMKVISPDTSMATKTSGRIEQWEAFPSVLWHSPIWGLGPGSGHSVSNSYAPKRIQWHSLYLKIGADLGIVGLALLSALLVGLLRRNLERLRTYHEVAPLLGTLCFMVLGLSVSGFDSLGGMSLGLGFAAVDGSKLFLYRANLNPKNGTRYCAGAERS